ncbi:uncharacterized protein K489DRAFT_235670 [Dissoconium aciculare CBS 342.82]|uniref:Uncharacterized protein n=1 Tax=Dissoconium aciculare CBS 342.82 TaxID=1314786 RepID=A0A6J3M5T0_9PEZI|nr:uncharacterized protein K489DRAFT_235670 [Dissoconium aciculare CBS 342.82]KAF1822202.1 hypothetical protein K489DRAFT_235670 [Dissoconium aciculare CBS 342.82]
MLSRARKVKPTTGIVSLRRVAIWRAGACSASILIGPSASLMRSHSAAPSTCLRTHLIDQSNGQDHGIVCRRFKVLLSRTSPCHRRAAHKAYLQMRNSQI